MPPDLALCLTLISSKYPCLEHIFMVPKVFEPLKFHCMVRVGLIYTHIRYMSMCKLDQHSWAHIRNQCNVRVREILCTRWTGQLGKYHHTPTLKYHHSVLSSIYRPEFYEKCLRGYLSYPHLPFHMNITFVVDATIFRS